MSQLRMELNSPSDSPKGIPVTLMYSKTSKQILFVEAGKDFVDLVMGFLTLPIGCIIKLLSESAMVTPKTVGGISNVFESIQRLEAEEKMCANKKLLIDPKPTYGLGSKYLVTDSEVGNSSEGDGAAEPAPQYYFTCGAIPHCSYVSVRYGTKCPRHQRKMTTQCKLIDGNEAPKCAREGYVKNGSKFFITDNLEIFPSSNSLALLKKLKVENMSSLDSLDIHVGTDEVLQLLRASLTSGNVLSDVFGKALQDTYVLAPLREILSQTDSISSLSRELLRSLERGKRLEAAVKEMAHERDRERRLYAAMREIDAAFQASLASCVEERELRISSALREIDVAAAAAGPAASEAPSRSHSSCVTRPSEKLGDQRTYYGRYSRDQRVVDRSDQVAAAPTPPCKEVLLLEKQVDKVMEKLCHLAAFGPPPPLDQPSPALSATSSKPKTQLAVRPPWTVSHYSQPSRVCDP